MGDMRSLRRLLEATRVDLSSETRAQADIEKMLQRRGIAYEREVRLSEQDRPDFLVGNVVIEVKLGGGGMEIYRQLARYALLSEVAEILLVTNRPLRLPPLIEGKPAAVAHLGAAWL